MSTTTVNTSPAAANTNQVTTWRPNLRGNFVTQEIKTISYEKVNAVDENGISIWIRFAFKNITPQRVFECLKKACLAEGEEPTFLGIIIRIDEVFRNDGNKMFFVHFAPNSWGKTSKAIDALKNLIAGELRVYYDRQYFWKLSISASKRPMDVDFPNSEHSFTDQLTIGNPPPASDLYCNYNVSFATNTNELTFNPEEMETNFTQECRDEILKEHGLKITDEGQVVDAN